LPVYFHRIGSAQTIAWQPFALARLVATIFHYTVMAAGKTPNICRHFEIKRKD